jgi:ComF family protein
MWAHHTVLSAMRSSFRSTSLTTNRYFKTSLCYTCQLWTNDVLCTDCLDAFSVASNRCPICALPVSVQLSGRCDCSDWTCSPTNSYALFNYSYPWNRLISQFKYQKKVNLADFFGRQLMQDKKIKAVIEQADVLCPIPLSKPRIQQRGYNQSFELAKKLAPHLSRPDIILRTHHVASQASLNRQQRLQNLSGVFQLDPFKSHLLRNKKVVLVDDVLTTGATIQAVCQVLQNADVAEVSVVVLARTLTMQQETLCSLCNNK